MSEQANNDRAFSDKRGDVDVESIGPFSHYPVTVNGWTVDRLEALYGDDGSVCLTLDKRFALDVTADLAARVIEFVADAIAIGHGWSCHPTSRDWTPNNDVPPMRLLPWHQMHGFGSVERDEDDGNRL